MRVLVLCGGRSSEHDVSLASGRSVLDAIDALGHDSVPVTVDRDGRWTIRDPRKNEDPGEVVTISPGAGPLFLDRERRGAPLRVDVVFPALHGPFGEDGSVQGLLESVDIPYVGSGVLASATCVDKLVFKETMKRASMPQVAFVAVDVREWRTDRRSVLERIAQLGYPVFSKPARLGSSVGISHVLDAADLPEALDGAFRHDPVVLVERQVEGCREIECSIIGNRELTVSSPGEIFVDAAWYDFDAKYVSGGMRLQAPAELPEELLARIMDMAANVYRSVRCSGLARVDFFVHARDEILVNELNTMPGFTPTSVFARLLEASGLSYEVVVDRLLSLAVEHHEESRRYLF